MAIQSKIYSGTSGLVLPVPNKLAYPPEFRDKSRLTYYASLFNSIEINSSFYKIPQASTVQKWAESVPDDFKFTYKLWREITHTKGLLFNAADVTRFMDTIRYAGNKKGCLLVQLAPSLTITVLPQLEKLLNCIRDSDPGREWNVAVEFRSRSWYNDEIYELIDQLGMCIVLHDLPASSTPFIESSSAFSYVRFHGPEGAYRGGYTDDFLHEYAQYIQEWKAEGKTVYVYFNNTIGDAVWNLMTLNNYMVSETGV